MIVDPITGMVTYDNISIVHWADRVAHEDTVWEPGIYDPEYDWGYADDGTAVPPPCPVDGVLYGACTSRNYDPNIILGYN